MLRRLWVAVALISCLAPACASNRSTRVTLDEYSVEAPADAESGRVTFDARNVGEIEHELVVLRTALRPDRLPVNDAEVQTGAPALDLVRKTSRIKSGDSRRLIVRLSPGPYVLICNVPGHYLSGMRASLRVI